MCGERDTDNLYAHDSNSQRGPSHPMHALWLASESVISTCSNGNALVGIIDINIPISALIGVSEFSKE